MSDEAQDAWRGSNFGRNRTYYSLTLGAIMHIALYGRHGAVGDKREKLVKDLKSVVADADELLKEVTNATTEELAAARTMIEARLGEARSSVNDARIAVTRKACDAADATQEYLVENRWKVLGIAAVAGLITALLLSRR
jgi:ElaB/YqjD/DUF883 family membrane-anchored ribosome-binding protein